MADLQTGSGGDSARMLEVLHALERRVARLESCLGIAEDGTTEERAEAAGVSTVGDQRLPYIDQSGIELRFGEFGLPWIGGGIFLLGIVFLMVYLSNLGLSLAASIFGYAATAGMYLLAGYWQERFEHLSRVMLSSCLLLFYYSTLRLHFFAAQPLIPSRNLALMLIIAVVLLQLSVAVFRNSRILAGLGMLLGVYSALVADSTQLSLSLIALFAAISVAMLFSKGWWLLVLETAALAYAAHVAWMVNNPIAGHPLRAVTEHQNNLVYLFLYAVIFTLPLLLHKTPQDDEVFPIILVGVNCLSFLAVNLLASFIFFRDAYAGVFLAVSVLFLTLSILLWQKTRREFAPAVYACFGYVTLSVAIYGYVGIPAAFLWLSLQCLLVVSMALWFRSKVIVVLNSLIYVGILLAYLAGSPSSDVANFSFALVALATARIMNWQKERLTLRTKHLRNTFLAISLVFVLYSLYHAVPGQYVTLAWTIAAAAYFLISIVLRNVKYRWMAMGTLFLAVGYLFFVDLARLDPRFRFVAFLFLGLMAVVISLFYSRIRRLVTGKKE